MEILPVEATLIMLKSGCTDRKKLAGEFRDHATAPIKSSRFT